VSRPPESLWATIAAVWRETDGAPRTQPLLIASICAGIAGYTLAEATGLPLAVSYVATVLVVFATATAALAIRRRGGG
jgi:hypothetical protein